MPTITPNDIKRKFTYYRIPLGMTVAEYYLDEHNINNISLPPKRKNPPNKVLIMEFEMMYKFGNNDDALDYVCKTINEENDLIPHYFTSAIGDWQVLKEDYEPSIHKKEETGYIAIGAITSSAEIGVPPIFIIPAMESAAKITAYTIYRKKLTLNDIRYLKRRSGGPHYIRDHWKEFMASVRKYYKKLGGK